MIKVKLLSFLLVCVISAEFLFVYFMLGVGVEVAVGKAYTCNPYMVSPERNRSY